MANISELVQSYIDNHDSCMLELDDVLGLAVNAVQYYAGWKSLEEAEDETYEISVNTVLTAGEWTLINPLFLLYVEKEQATQMESAQVMGITQYGRTSSEVQSDIAAIQESLPRLSFSSEIITV
ncbi:MAG: hypothetical protein ACPGGD_10795 [Thalassolituus sp.]|jgi:hypothetical protein